MVLSQIDCPGDLSPNGAGLPWWKGRKKRKRPAISKLVRMRKFNRTKDLRLLFYFLRLFRFQSFSTVRDYVVDIDLATQSPESFETEKKEVKKGSIKAYLNLILIPRTFLFNFRDPATFRYWHHLPAWEWGTESNQWTNERQIQSILSYSAINGHFTWPTVEKNSDCASIFELKKLWLQIIHKLVWGWY